MSVSTQSKVLELQAGLSNPEAFRPALTRRQLEVLRELYKGGQMPQGELARRTQMKATSLSNLLLRLDSLYPDLFLKEYQGRFCYYALSDWGRRFVEEQLEPAREQESAVLLNREDEVLFESADESVRELRRLYEEEWPAAFNDVLMFYMAGGRLLPDSQAKALVNQYLRSLELLTVHENERFKEQTLKLVSDPVNRSRIAKFVDEYFAPFLVVLRSLQEKRQTFAVSSILRAVFTGQTDVAEKQEARSIGWDSEALHDLEKAARQLRVRLNGCAPEAIYDYLSALLPDQEMLCVLISQWLVEN